MIWAAIAFIALPLAIVLAFWWAPVNVISIIGGVEQGDFPQKIFYLHVPIAFAAYWGFIVGAWNAILYLRSGDDMHDLRSYVGVHVGMVFGTLVLITGSVWAKAAWGTWWQWGDRQLLVFLILYLFYASYFMVRFSIDPGPYRARVSSIVTLLGLALVPMSFLAIRIADTLIHPTVIESDGLAMPASMGWTFLIASIGMIALSTLMMYVETGTKTVSALLAARRRGTAEASATTDSQATARPATADPVVAAPAGGSDGA